MFAFKKIGVLVKIEVNLKFLLDFVKIVKYVNEMLNFFKSFIVGP